MPRITTTVAQEVEEEITSYDHHLESRSFHIAVGTMMNSTYENLRTGESTPISVLNTDIPIENIRVSEHNYRALFSTAPAWNPDKDSGSYSLEDLWIVVDAQRAGVNLDIGSEA